jgi:geranylgeranyl diphosphate synthase type II
MSGVSMDERLHSASELKELIGADIHEKLEIRLKDALEQLPPRLCYRLQEFILHRQRKMLRASLTVLVAQTLLRGRDKEDAINRAFSSAVAVELLHNMTLIHDDLIDNAPLRRGHQSYHLRYGKELAIHDADILYAYALTLIEDMASLQLILKASYNLALGNLAELEDRITNCFDFDGSHVINIMERKTALLLSECVRLGYYAVGLPQRFTPHLERATLDAGIAFQIQDDYLATVGTPEKFGKAPFWDIQESKRNLFLLFALLSPHRNRIREIYGKPLGEKSSQDIRFVSEVFEEVAASVRQLRDEYLHNALTRLQNLRNEETDSNEVAVYEFLLKMIHFFARRDQ